MKIKRVYIKHNAYHFVSPSGKWHRLCALADGEATMLRELAKHKDAPTPVPGSMGALWRAWWKDFKATYAESTQADYELMFPKIEAAFIDFPHVRDTTPKAVYDFTRQWKNRPRQANKYLSLLSMMFAFSCAPLAWRNDNPCDQVKPLDTGPKRSRYITDREFYKIRQGAKIGKNGRVVPSGEMIVCAIDLAYLTFQRQGEIRRLKATDDEWLFFKPTKTESTTGARVRWKRTPEIDAVLARAKAFGKVKPLDGQVIHNLKGKPYTKSGIETAWRRACARAGVIDANFHDLRGKAQTDAKARGYTMEQIRDGATHADTKTTDGYIKLREELVSLIELPMPNLDTGAIS